MTNGIELQKCPCGSREKPACGHFAFWYAAKCPDCARRVEGGSLKEMAEKWNAREGSA